MICDFDFYISKFHGDKFKTSPEQFIKNGIKAGYILKKYGIDTADVTDNIKMCYCALAELAADAHESEVAEVKNISSESVQGYSVSYGTSTTATKTINRKAKDIIALYLGAEALYRGRGRYVL